MQIDGILRMPYARLRLALLALYLNYFQLLLITFVMSRLSAEPVPAVVKCEPKGEHSPFRGMGSNRSRILLAMKKILSSEKTFSFPKKRFAKRTVFVKERMS
ncbi:MAG: hypothetical protein JW744_00825 [Candidatus Diapherotrites archaeon]|uniref:Uncharacterized protein n=1 Tax=Candidatus Iainarchaeum sp. TaxID=3101447 RepID=A0A939C625_9ARCH|nr:hypothetical protein [Candidatus Diapherotrites archaeon]